MKVVDTTIAYPFDFEISHFVLRAIGTVSEDSPLICSHLLALPNYWKVYTGSPSCDSIDYLIRP